MSVDPDELVAQRRARLDAVLLERGVAAVLTTDPFSIRYATGTRNMLVHGLTGPDRLALVVAGGATVLWEQAGCEHLTASALHVDELRVAPALTAKKSAGWRDEARQFAAEVATELQLAVGPGQRLGVDRVDLEVADGLRRLGVDVVDGIALVQEAMAIKQPAEIDAMRLAMTATESATAAMEQSITPGQTEQEVWAEFHRALIAGGGELVVTRLLQAGRRTFPYFQEASDHVLASGDLVCFDSDAVGAGGYSVDFSRTFLCGDGPATGIQRSLYQLALDQLEHNASILAAGRSFEELAAKAFAVPEPFARYEYYQLAHGLGLAGGHPNVPRMPADGGPYPLPGTIEDGMVLCVESYIGDPDSAQGVKLENQYLIGQHGVEQLSTYPLEPRLLVGA